MTERRTIAMTLLRRLAVLLALTATALSAGAQPPSWVPAQPDVIGGPWNVQGPARATTASSRASPTCPSREP